MFNVACFIQDSILFILLIYLIYFVLIRRICNNVYTQYL